MDPMTLELFEAVLRIVRVFLVMIGLAAVTFLLKGSFDYTLSSGRNDDQVKAWGKITVSLFVTIIVAVLFVVATVMLRELTV